MKKSISIAVTFCCMFFTQLGFAAQDQACNECPPDQACNDCYCLYVHYEPCYYTTQRCVEEVVPCTKRCCRQVPKYCEVERCRMVPEYYTETVCYYENEYYDEPDCKTCKKWVCDEHCEYVPQYYWKHACGNECNNLACPQ